MARDAGWVRRKRWRRRRRRRGECRHHTRCCTWCDVEERRELEWESFMWIRRAAVRANMNQHAREAFKLHWQPRRGMRISVAQNIRRIPIFPKMFKCLSERCRLSKADHVGVERWSQRLCQLLHERDHSNCNVVKPRVELCSVLRPCWRAPRVVPEGEHLRDERGSGLRRGKGETCGLDGERGRLVA